MQSRRPIGQGHPALARRTTRRVAQEEVVIDIDSRTIDAQGAGLRARTENALRRCRDVAVDVFVMGPLPAATVAAGLSSNSCSHSMVNPALATAVTMSPSVSIHWYGCGWDGWPLGRRSSPRREYEGFAFGVEVWEFEPRARCPRRTCQAGGGTPPDRGCRRASEAPQRPMPTVEAQVANSAP